MWADLGPEGIQHPNTQMGKKPDPGKRSWVESMEVNLLPHLQNRNRDLPDFASELAPPLGSVVKAWSSGSVSILFVFMDVLESTTCV